MQVHLTSHLPNPAGETGAKSAETPEADAANGFLAQMGQIMNRSEGNNNAREESARSVPDSNSSRKNLRNSVRDADSGSISRRFQEEDPEVSGAPVVQSGHRGGGKFTGMRTMAGIEPNSVQIEDEDEEMAGSVSSVHFPVHPTSAAGNPQSIITLDWGAYAEEIVHSQKAGSKDPSAVNGGKTIAEAGTGFRAGAFQDAKTAGQPGWNVEPETSGSVNDATGSTAPGGNSQKAIKVEPGDALRSVSAQAVASNEADSTAALQARAKTTQLNFDFPAAGPSESRMEISGQSVWISKMRKPGFTDDIVPEVADLQNGMPRGTTLKNSLKAGQPSQENAESANGSTDQGQPGYKPVSWAALQAKPEQGQFNPGQQHSSAAEHPFQNQPVFALSAAQSAESAVAASAPPLQPSTSQVPEVVLQMADQIRIQVRDGKGEIRIQLKPDGLGRLEIRAESTVNGVFARISTESNAVKSYLENNLHVLQQTLQDQGLKIDRIHIIFQDAFDSQSSSGFSAQFGHAGTGQNGREPKLSSGMSGSSPVNPTEEAILDRASWLALNPNNRFYTVA